MPPGRCMKQKSIILLLSNSTKTCFSVGGNKGGPAYAVFPPNETPSAETDAVHQTVVSLSDVPARDSPDAKMLHKVTTAEDKSKTVKTDTKRDIPTDPRSNRAWKSELLRGWKIFSFTSKSRMDTKEAKIVFEETHR